MTDAGTIATVAAVSVGGMAALILVMWSKMPKPPSQPKPERKKETQTDIPLNEAPKKFPLEIVRRVAGNQNPVVVKRRMISNTAEIVDFKNMKPLPRTYFIGSVIRRETEIRGFLGRKKTMINYLARCNQYWSESLDSLDQDTPKYSQELSNLLLADDEKQHIDGVVAIQKFILDSTIIKLIVVVLGMSIPFGLFMIELLHLVPAQIVIWSP